MPQAADAWPRPWGNAQPTTPGRRLTAGHTPKVTAEITPPQRAHRGHDWATAVPLLPSKRSPRRRRRRGRVRLPGPPSNNTDRLTSARRRSHPETAHRYWHRGNTYTQWLMAVRGVPPMCHNIYGPPTTDYYVAMPEVCQKTAANCPRPE